MTAALDPQLAPRRIFLSYGHDEYVPFAEFVKEDLKARGHEVCFDQERLRPGVDWERYIEEGLEWASRAPGEGCFVLIMTPHSVRRPDGYCLNELARALRRNLPVVPLMLATVEPPLSIARLQWLDARDCWPVDRIPDAFVRRRAQLLDAIEHQRLDFDGVHARLLERLRPIAFDNDIDRHLADFTGREWITNAYNAWLADPRAARVFWLTGKPGVGKSALAAKFIVSRPEIAAIHMCRQGDSEKADPRRAIQSIAFQLASQLPDYRDRLNALDLDRLVGDANAAALFDSLIVQPLARLPARANPIVVLIDALDEATHGDENALAGLIGARFEDAPPWLRLFATSRDEEEVRHQLQALTPRTLDAANEENRNDLRRYLTGQLAALAPNGAVDHDIVETVLDKSEGLFLYARWVCREIAAGRLPLDRPDAFPAGLGGIYWQFFERQFPDVATYGQRYRPALEVLAAALEPPTTDLLASVFGWSPYDTNEMLGAFGALFPERRGRVEPFHLSVLDWIKDRRKAGQYWVDPIAGHERLARHGLAEFRGGASGMSRYSVLHLPSHLAAIPSLGRELTTLLLDFDWMQRKLDATDIIGLQRDYALQPDHEGPQLVCGALRRGALSLQRDRTLLAGQLLGRLQSSPVCATLVKRAAEWRGAPWLRPLASSLTPPDDALRIPLLGHQGTVRSLAITPNGHRAVTAGNSHPDQTVRLWDLEFGTEIACLVGEAAEGYTPVALTADGRWALYGFHRDINVWDVSRAERAHTLSGHRGDVRTIAIAPYAPRVVSGSTDGDVLVWDSETWQLRGTPLEHGDFVSSIVISRDGRFAVSASETCVKVWDLDQGTEQRRIAESTGFTSGWPQPLLAFMPDERSVCFGDPARRWDLATDARSPLTHTAERVQVLAADARMQVALVVNDLEGLRVWDLPRAVELYRIPSPERKATAVAITADASMAIDAFYTHEVRVWNLERLAKSPARGWSRGRPESIVITNDGRHAVVLNADQTSTVWSVATGAQLEPSPATDSIRDEALAHLVATRAATRDQPRRPQKHAARKQVKKAASSRAPVPIPVGERHDIELREEAWTLRLLDRDSGRVVTTFTCDAIIACCAVAPDGTIVVADTSGAVHFLRLDLPAA